MTTKIYAPRQGDRAMLARIARRWHVSKPNDEIEAYVRDMFARADVVPASGERTIRAWINAAIAAHEQNCDLFYRVARGQYNH